MTREGEAEFSNVFTGVSAIGRSTNFTADGQILDVRSLLAKNGEASPGGALLRLAPGSAQRRRGFLCRRLASAGRPALSSAPCGSCGSWTRSCPSALWLVQAVVAFSVHYYTSFFISWQGLYAVSGRGRTVGAPLSCTTNGRSPTALYQLAC